MPVGRTTTSSEIRAIAMVGFGLAVIIVGVVFFFNAVGSRGDVKVRLGDDFFDAGNAEDIADEIGERGPILYSDVAGGSRDIYVNHLGDDHEQGWLAFEARLPGDPRDCYARWEPDLDHFSYTCDESRTFPSDGTGLTALSIEVRSGDVIVDINAAQRASTTTGAGSDSSVVMSGS